MRRFGMSLACTVVLLATPREARPCADVVYADDCNPCGSGQGCIGQPPICCSSRKCIDGSLGDGLYCGGFPGSAEDKCDPDCPVVARPRKPIPANTCPSPRIGDPVNITSGVSDLHEADLALQTGAGPLDFARMYVSQDDIWRFRNALADTPAPFGHSPSDSMSARWWHNYFAYVYVGAGYRWDVRDQGGKLIMFEPCYGTPPCSATLPVTSKSARERLEKTAGGFVLYRDDGSKLVFEDTWTKADAGSPTHYFLTRVVSPTGVTAAGLAYSDAGVCPADPTSKGAPYLRQIDGAGASLSFSYSRLQLPDAGYECVLSQVSVVGASGLAASYTYDAGPGLVTDVSWATGRAQSYQYDTSQLIRRNDGLEVMRHNYGGGNVSSASWQGSNWSFDWQDGGGAQSCGMTADRRTVTSSTARAGDETNAAVSLATTYETVSNVGQLLEPRLYSRTDACADAGSCSPGTERWEWACSSDAGIGFEKAYQDKRGNWEAYTRLVVDAGYGRQVLELTKTQKGAADMNGANALEETRYQYLYGDGGVQLLAREDRDSVLGGAGQVATTYYAYDTNSNRLKSVIRSGFTASADAGTWSTGRRYLGTFYFTNQPCEGGGTPDPLGRTLEVHGPCWVSSETATDCAASPYPVTQYGYWPANDPANRRNQLATVTRRTGTGGSCTGTALTTQLSQYDGLGHPTTIVDPNNVTETLTYSGDELTSRNIAQGGLDAGTTTYGRLNGKLTSVQYPQGNFEVYCYTNAAAPPCTGTWTGQLKWKAKAADATANAWSERVSYDYWPDGTLASEIYYLTGDGQPRRVKRYAADAHRRPTFEGWGDATAAGRFSATKGFDRADNLVGVGLPFNAPPAWCGGVTNDTPSSKLCSWLGYLWACQLRHEIASESGDFSGVLFLERRDGWCSWRSKSARPAA